MGFFGISCYLSFLGVASASWELPPWGDFIQKVNQSKHQPSYGDYSIDAEMGLFRTQSIPIKNCSDWIRHGSMKLGNFMTPLTWGSAVDPSAPWPWGAWEPWSAEEKKGIQNCDQQPCQVKLHDDEVLQLKAQPPHQRFPTYFDQIQKRLLHYIKTQQRLSYESPGPAPKDPWKRMEEMGWPVGTPPPLAHYGLRRLDLGSSSVQVIHQLLDIRWKETPPGESNSGAKIDLWVRDVYTDHYFDSWGEWWHGHCLSQQEIFFVQILILEVDLLKQTDILSRLMRGKMKSALKDQGYRYLDRMFQQLRVELDR